MLKIEALASGSNGNSVLIGDRETKILIDAGISAKRITDSLVEAGVFPGELKGIFITHEHADHVAGLRVFASKFQIPVFTGEGTMEELVRKDPKLCGIRERFTPLENGSTVTVGSLRVTAFSTFHDAREPLAFRIESEGTSAAVFTDSGVCTQPMEGFLRDTDILYLESNHDVRMLETGSYPYSLKRRVLGRLGHLSNDSAAQVIKDVIGPKLKLLILAHLSEENNLPELCELNMKNTLRELNREDVRLIVAERTSKTPLFTIE